MNVPIGGIVMYEGYWDADLGAWVVTVPAGYHVCDGTAGTPNLTRRFVLGAGGGYAPGTIGGAASMYLLHSHAALGDTAAPSVGHDHTLTIVTSDFTASVIGQSGPSIVIAVLPTHHHHLSNPPLATTEDHNHAMEGDSSSSGIGLDLTPACVLLLFIMRLS